MHIDYLVRMANDIGAFFNAETDKDSAAAQIQLHIRRFWDPRMRAQIIEHYKESKGAGLEGPVLVAVKNLAAEADKKKASA